jgi:hypothetical protein
MGVQYVTLCGKEAGGQSDRIFNRGLTCYSCHPTRAGWHAKQRGDKAARCSAKASI